MVLSSSVVNDKNSGDGGDGDGEARGARISPLRRRTPLAPLPLSTRRKIQAQHDGGLKPHAVQVPFCLSSAVQRLSNFGRHGFKVIRFGEGFDKRFALAIYKVDLAKGTLFLPIQRIKFKRASKKRCVIFG